jgi:hypothetical protein
MHTPQPWSPADATLCLNALGKSPDLSLSLTRHAQDRLEERDLTIGDVLYILHRGFVLEPYEAATRAKLFKYKILSATPNSENRSVAVVVIPDPVSLQVKIVTVMWQD